MAQLKAPFSVTPKPRFFNLSLNVNNLSLTNSAKFVFPESAILRYITVVTSSSTNGPLGSINMALAFNAPDIAGATFVPVDGVIYADSFTPTLGVGAGVELNGTKATYIDTQDMLIGASEFILARIIGTGTFTGVLDASIAFNPLSEWINFREPTSGVRI
jgi:hypothetical protein